MVSTDLQSTIYLRYIKSIENQISTRISDTNVINEFQMRISDKSAVSGLGVFFTRSPSSESIRVQLQKKAFASYDLVFSYCLLGLSDGACCGWYLHNHRLLFSRGFCSDVPQYGDVTIRKNLFHKGQESAILALPEMVNRAEQ